MHGQLSIGGKHVVHHGEHGLLVHAAVVSAADDERHAVCDVHDHATVRNRAVAFGVSTEAWNVDDRPALFETVAVVADVLREHDVAEVGVRRVLANETVWLRELWVPAAEYVGHIQGRLALVEMLDDPGKERIELVRVELAKAGLPPDGVDNFGTGNSEGVIDRTTSAGRVRVIDQRTVDAECRRVRLLLIIAAVERDTTSVVLDGCVEQFLLAEADFEVRSGEPELGFELSCDVHLLVLSDRYAIRTVLSYQFPNILKRDYRSKSHHF